MSSPSDDLNPYGCQFNDMEAFYKQKLGIETAKVQYRYVRVKDYRTQGYAQQAGKGQYRITLANWLEDSELRVTLAHELVHVRQLERGQIDLSEFEKHYHDRSFEDEAFRLSIPMAAEFYTQHKCNKSNTKAKAKTKAKKPGHKKTGSQ
ncbi:hypothetical protein [Endozoicomonas montiporae]|nr:hypothetical protein [Endozoicomonas montiporae]